MTNEIFISIDVETSGPLPGVNYMMSLGAAAFSADGKLLSTFEMNLEPVPGTVAEARTTIEFWDKNPEAFKHATANQEKPQVVMDQFTKWVNSFPGSKVAVAFPAGFDFLFVYWYLIRFTGSSPFSFSCLDIKTYASAVLSRPYRSATKRNWPHSWFEPSLKHTHKASDDALEQGLSFLKMRAYNISGEDGVEDVRKNFLASYNPSATYLLHTAAVNDILWRQWDPIGCGVPEDEYESYVPQVLEILRCNDEETALNMLYGFLCFTYRGMSLPATPESDDKNKTVAQLLVTTFHSVVRGIK